MAVVLRKHLLNYMHMQMGATRGSFLKVQIKFYKVEEKKYTKNKNHKIINTLKENRREREKWGEDD